MSGQKIIFIEKLNILTLVILFIKRHRFSEVVIHETYDCGNFSRSAYSTYKIYEKLCNLLFKGSVFTIIPEFINRRNASWVANQKGIEFLQFYEPNLEKDFWGEFLINRLGTKRALQSVKTPLKEGIAQKILFFLQCEELEKLYRDNLFMFIPSGIDYFEIKKYLVLNLPARKVLKKHNFILRVKDTVPTILLALEVLISPFLELFRNGFSWKNPTLKQYDVAQHIASGFDTPEYREFRGMKTSRTDDEVFNILKDKNVSFLFLFAHWRYPDRVKKSFQRYIKNINADYAEEMNNPIPLKFFLKKYLAFYSLPFSAAILYKVLQAGYTNRWLLVSIRNALICAVKFELFNQYHRVKIMIGRDDYASSSPIRTIIQNKYGLKNMGISHSQNTYLRHRQGACFLHYDTYFIRGEGCRSKIFYPYWEVIKKIVVVGELESDTIYRAKNNSGLKSLFQEKYKDYITILLLIGCPRGFRRFPHEKVKEKYANLPDIVEMDKRIHIIIRPRNILALNYFLEHFPKYKLYIEKSRISVELHQFNTYELLAFCDLVISEENSGISFETRSVDGAWPISMGIRHDEPVLLKYHKDFVAFNFEQLQNIILKWLSNEFDSDISVAVDKLKKDFAPFNDDLSWNRVADEVYNELSMFK